MTDDICGYEKTDGELCQLPDCRDDGRCWHHTEIEEQRANGGRPNVIDDHKERVIFTAVSSGLKVKDQASLAQISPDTLRRYACCISNLREAKIEVDNPCDFCGSYARAHSKGAMEVLNNCRPEFVASASFDYTKKQEFEHGTAEGDEDAFGPTIVMSDDYDPNPD